MGQPMFVWLGSGRARKRHVGDKGRFLDEAARAGLPVPAGAILLDEFYRFCLDHDLAQRTDGRLVIPDIELWHNTLFHSVRLPSFNQTVAVRPMRFSADAPDGSAPAARLWVDLSDPEAAAGAVSAVWAASHCPQTARADVLIMEMVTAGHAGHVRLNESDADEVSVTSPAAATFSLLRLPPRRAPDGSLPLFTRRLQMLLRGCRRTFGSAVGEIEWADNGAICYLIGASAA